MVKALFLGEGFCFFEYFVNKEKTKAQLIIFAHDGAVNKKAISCKRNSKIKQDFSKSLKIK
ncbi:hypothetical protein ACMX02_00180 [Bartonella bacilliformis]|uniref:Uncharacterized protein n=3 Tax=Bartonella bacilliformis TaxID=774 RepID=A1UQY1_BARBK|nr:hypothetical protein [Bartonella bacilliformis]ABM44950.1 hypothetical protein BARBAKC583_0045 [Bartonella bacilliformis KC583]EKS45942.1 hypothetical protein BbINS_00220 [Bartonella bacilliformis INS]AMG85281.1 hypothetical protein AL467_00385 [Bartonella bacilliformis]KZM38219.1 hypothetical protein AWH67_00935 [Bartonella bacilliformis]KZN22232.1 hypothetical protein A6B38_00770 [Bartonella bacilliformis]